MEKEIYSLISEKKINGKLYQAFRNDNNPKDCYILIDRIEKINVNNIKEYWSKLCQ